MQVIISHTNTDFDAFASMIAAKKLYPEAMLVLSDKTTTPVKQFLNIYRDTFHIVPENHIDWEKVTRLILVDVASLQRIGNVPKDLPLHNIEVIVYDHHPPRDTDVKTENRYVEPVGAAVTLLIEELKRRNITISEFEATIFGLGIYTDTGNFTYQTTTTRDFEAASYLLQCGMNLEMIQRFSQQSLLPEQQTLMDQLFINSEVIELEGLLIVLTKYNLEKFQGGLATLTQKLLEMKGSDGAISVVKMKQHVYIVGRANADRINLLPLLRRFGGGGHQHAGSATVKRAELEDVFTEVTDHLQLILQPAVTARQIMNSPVKTITSDTTIEKAGKLMYRYGHSGYPIVEKGDLVGIITRRDLDKANHHGLGHAPVKAYMSTNLITVHPSSTLEEIQKIIIEHNIGRLPVVENGRIIGIVTRTDIIREIHSQVLREEHSNNSSDKLKSNIKNEMAEQLPNEIFSLLQKISKIATNTNTKVYLIGGIVRDILLQRPNDDVDLVVEGDGIAFAKQLYEEFGGSLTVHESFGTATWYATNELSIDVASSRLEYYDKPAMLPEVERSTLQDDLYRRDFTINAMAIHLSEERFGEIVDPFSGQLDLYEKTIKVLHNLSFVEDPTRILRAVRFEVRFDFKMDEQTEQLALQSIEQMQDVSHHRILTEIERMYKEEDPLKTTNRLYELQFWQQFIKGKINIETAIDFTKKLKDLYQLKTRTQSEVNNFHWFTYFVIPFFVANDLNKVKPFALKKEEIKFIREIEQLVKIPKQEVSNIGQLHEHYKLVSDDAILFLLAIGQLTNEKVVLQYLEKRRHLPIYITGDQLKEFGIRQGPIYKQILTALDVAILNDEINSEIEAEQWLKQYMKTL